MTDDSAIAVMLENLFYIFNNWAKHRFENYFLQNNSDLTLNQYRVLFTLKEHKNIKMSDLSKRLNTTMGSLTVMIDRLIKKKLVERSFSAEDRRLVLINITEDGKDIVKEFREGLVKLIIKDIEKLNENDKNALYNAAKQIQHIVGSNLI